MKKVKIYALAALMAGSLASCADFLDRYPQDSVNNETYWKTEEQLRAALYPCYEAFHKDFIINWSESTAETCMWGNITSGLSKVSGGKHSYTDGFPFTTYWQQAYGYIFNCNNFLDNYNKAEMPQDDKDVYAAEVKVIRAYMYFLLTTFWGDVPWVDHVITADEAYVPRDPRSKVIDNVISDSYDLWDYAKVYQTEGDVETNPANIESIIFSLYVPDIRIHNVSNETCCPVDYIRLNASKSLVDAYLCTDGKPAKAGLEYYHNDNIVTSDLYKFPEEHYADYFQNRDPRMAMTLYCPGDAWPGGDDGDSEERKPNKTFNLPRFSSLQSGINGANSRTGFYFKKYNDPNIAGNYNLSHNNLNVIRYPEVLLIYAEALYKTNGTLTQPQIDETINKLRKRVGMHEMRLEELSAWNLDLWTEIKRERRIEMTMDGMRYADIMRWREGELRFGRAITGPSAQVCINDLGANPYADNGVDEFGDIIYEKSRAEGGARYFDPSMHYLWPVPYAERVKNPLLGQNPGWPQ